MKSFVTHAVSVMEGIFLDASTRWPDLRDSFGKDLSYLRRAVESRGLPFLTVVLPAMGKVLDKGLDSGRLEVSEIPKGFPKIKNRPEFLQGLFLQVFDDRSMLRDDACIDSVAFLRQFLYCCKRLRIECDLSKTRSALNEFFAVERHLPPSYPDTWDCEVPTWQERTGHPLWGEGPTSADQDLFRGPGPRSAISPHYWDRLRHLCRYIVSHLGEPDWWSISPRHGPGAVSEPIKGMSKYDFPNWASKLERQFPFDWFGSGSLEPKFVPKDHELPSRLIAVPKDQRGPRIICCEPLSHQWIQQGIRYWLEDRMRSTELGRSITLRDQENSRNRALRSSFDGKLATVDLSAASDRLSTRLVEYVFQGSPILDGMHACRTRVVYQNILGDCDSHYLLRKFSTMGSALTFPVQSIVFCILSVFALRMADGRLDTPLSSVKDDFDQVTVYGDDIIIPVRALNAVKLVLHECGLKVNTDKTFGGNGCFRESCGMDAFRGYDVTPAYILQPYDVSPSSLATTVEVANNFFRKGYWHASSVVVSQLPKAELKLLRVCGRGDGAFGLFSFVGTDTSHLKSGWDQSYHRDYSISLGVSSKTSKVRGRGFADLSQYFFESPDQDLPWSAGQVSRVRLRKSRIRVFD